MRLTKFRVKDIQETISEHKSTPGYLTSSGLKFGKETIEKRFNYVITDTNGREYHLHSWDKPINMALISEARCFEYTGLNSDHSSIKNHSSYPNYFLTPSEFKKAKADYLERAKQSVEREQAEYDRLLAL